MSGEEAMEDHRTSAGAGPGPVSASYQRFRAGLDRARGYDLHEQGDCLSLRFDPWFAESAPPSGEPCLRIQLRKEGDRIVLESFVVEADGEPRSVDLDAARDALQSWMDYTCD